MARLRAGPTTNGGDRSDARSLCAARVIWCSDRSVFVMGERITSASNEWADIGSRPVTRGGPAAVATMAHELGLEFVDFPCVRLVHLVTVMVST